MLYNLVPSQYSHIVLALGIVLAYVITWLDLHHFMSRLPKDHGKALAVEADEGTAPLVLPGIDECTTELNVIQGPSITILAKPRED